MTSDLTGVPAGNYRLTITEGACSVDLGPYTVDENCPACDLALTVSTENATCGRNNGNAVVNVSGGTAPLDIRWEDANGVEVGSAPILSGIFGGAYTVTVTDGNGCSETAIAEVQPLGGSVPEVDLGSDQTLCQGDTLRLSAAAQAATYLWQDGRTEPFFPVTKEGNYELTVTNDCGCATDQVYIAVETCTDPPVFEIRIANTLTPNSDGDNDTFFIENIWQYPDNRLEVFNRWGVKIYEATGYSNEWEGTHNGKRVPTGTYYYILKVNGQQLKGSISVIR